MVGSQPRFDIWLWYKLRHEVVLYFKRDPRPFEIEDVVRSLNLSRLTTRARKNLAYLSSSTLKGTAAQHYVEFAPRCYDPKECSIFAGQEILPDVLSTENHLFQLGQLGGLWKITLPSRGDAAVCCPENLAASSGVLNWDEVFLMR
jgi:hypothetical protein